MSFVLLFFGDSEPVVQGEPLAIELGSLFDVAGSISNSFEQFPMDISVEAASEVVAELFVNNMSVGVTSRPKARMLFSTEETLSILATSFPDVRITFEPDPVIDISVTSTGVLRIKFADSSEASFFDIVATSGIRSRVEFVQGQGQGDQADIGQDEQLEYIPFII